MIYIESGSESPFYNFALEYYLMKERPFPDDMVFMFWRTRPTVMVGAFQNTYNEVNLDYVNKNGVQVVRRMSGGGAIFTDMGSWQFSFIAKMDAPKICFEQFVAPIAKALKALGLDVSLSGRNDLTIDGRKFSGNAQCHKYGYALHHGSILFDTDIEHMVRSTTVDEYKIVAKGIKSVRERVVNICGYFAEMPTMQEFKRMMVESVTGGRDCEYRLTPAEIERVCAISRERFEPWERVYGASPKCSIVRKNRFAGGGVECHLEIVSGKISDIRIYGDFFGTPDIPALCALLVDCEYRAEAVRKRLAGSFAAESIYKINLDELVMAIVGK